MDVNEPVDTERAWLQWRRLRDTLVELGVRVHLIGPVAGLPDMVFTGDAGVVLGNRFVSSNVRPKERRPEAGRFRVWFAEQGFSVETLPEDVFFEGLGDVVLHGRTASRKAIEALPQEMIPVSDEDARRFALDAVVVGRKLVVNHCSSRLRAELESRDFEVIVIDVAEFVKSGGGTRCLVLRYAC